MNINYEEDVEKVEQAIAKDLAEASSKVQNTLGPIEYKGISEFSSSGVTFSGCVKTRRLLCCRGTANISPGLPGAGLAICFSPASIASGMARLNVHSMVRVFFFGIFLSQQWDMYHSIPIIQANSIIIKLFTTL